MPHSRLAVASALAAVMSGASLYAAVAQEVNADPAAAPAGLYKLDKSHTSVTMKVTHLGISYYTMRFDKVQGDYTYDSAHPEATKVEVTIDPASVDTGDEGFNRQIASQVFEADKYPQIKFVSTGLRSTSDGRGVLVGDLTFHGVTKSVNLDVIYNGLGRGLLHEPRMGFSATTVIRRSNFGAAKYEPMVGDEVSVMIETEFGK
jgi:polyisoprenoid-binding protein YceI